jgi:hypothetical protein
MQRVNRDESSLFSACCAITLLFLSDIGSDHRMRVLTSVVACFTENVITKVH